MSYTIYNCIYFSTIYIYIYIYIYIEVYIHIYIYICINIRAGPINDIISNRDKIYVDNDDKLWTLLLDMD